MDQKDLRKFCYRLSDLMTEKGLTQRSLAEVLGVHASTVSQWMNGRNAISVGVLVKIADHFDVSTDYLLGRTDNRERR